MLNLNYNIIGSSTLQRAGEVVEGFAPYIRPDAYSGSIVLAIPGTLFKRDYENLFGMTDIFSDISAYVRGNGNQVGSSYTIIPTGSFVTGSSNVVRWDSQGYNTSIWVGDGAVGQVKNSGAGSGVNLSTGSNWVVEAWVAFPQTASATTPYHRLAWKQAGGNAPLADSYALDIWSGQTPSIAPGLLPTPFPITNQSGSLRFAIDDGGSEVMYYATASGASNPIVPTQWNHVAFSYNINDKGLAGRNVYRAFWNGRMIIEQQPDGTSPVITQPSPNYLPDLYLQLMGTSSGSNYSQAYFQDFRMYNGTNKNYTSSFDVNQVQSIVVARPY